MTGPAMIMVNIRYVHEDVDHRYGNVRIYFRRPGGPKVRIREAPGTEAIFDRYRSSPKLTGVRSHLRVGRSTSPNPAPTVGYAVNTSRHPASASLIRALNASVGAFSN
jgi:hypothetical protein